MARLRYLLRWDETFRKTLDEQAQLVEEEHIQTKPAKIQKLVNHSR